MNRAKAVINTDNIKHNLRIIKEKSENEIIGIVKSNAYGLGAVEISKILRNEKISLLGVAFVHEAIEIRNSGDNGQIYITAPVSEFELTDIVNYNLEPSISNIRILKKLDAIASENKKKVNIHLYIDTGMNRDGIKPNDIYKFLNIIKQTDNLKVKGLLTHFISAGQHKKQTEKQVDLLESVLEILNKNGIKPNHIHTHNSSAIFNNITNIGNYSRPGLSIYGFLKDSKSALKQNLKPVVSLQSEISLIKEVKAGEAIGYGNNYISPSNKRIAVIPYGYGHGLPWQLSNCGYFSINETKCKILGSVCMDMTMVDITNVEAKIGDKIIIMGNSKNSMDIYEISKLANTIPYHILTSITSRVERIYTNVEN